jgi:hypothetical protein
MQEGELNACQQQASDLVARLNVSYGKHRQDVRLEQLLRYALSNADAVAMWLRKIEEEA